MERQQTDPEIETKMEVARKNEVHIDTVVNPFLKQEDRSHILEGKMQDPEWD